MNETQKFYEYLKTNIATSTMVSDATGISQKNLCRYKRDLEEAGELFEVRYDKCQSTGFPAWYLSTDPDQEPIKNQLKLFEL